MKRSAREGERASLAGAGFGVMQLRQPFLAPFLAAFGGNQESRKANQPLGPRHEEAPFMCCRRG